MEHFFTTPDKINDGTILIEGSDVRHILGVLRMKPGDKLMISDGLGTDYTCKISASGPEKITCTVLCESESRGEPSVRFYLFQGLAKADKLETVIQKSVELGVFEIIPVETARSVVKYDSGKKKAKLNRWQKISESAAKQSRRGIIPRVGEILSFEDALLYAAALDMILIPYENFKDMKATRQTFSNIKPGMSVGIFIGPEGGFESREVDLAAERGAVPVSLGSRILRTETAPLAILSILMFMLEE